MYYKSIKQIDWVKNLILIGIILFFLTSCAGFLITLEYNTYFSIKVIKIKGDLVYIIVERRLKRDATHLLHHQSSSSKILKQELFEGIFHKSDLINKKKIKFIKIADYAHYIDVDKRELIISKSGCKIGCVIHSGYLKKVDLIRLVLNPRKLKVDIEDGGIDYKVKVATLFANNTNIKENSLIVTITNKITGKTTEIRKKCIFEDKNKETPYSFHAYTKERPYEEMWKIIQDYKKLGYSS